MTKSLIWDIYEISSGDADSKGVMFRGKIRKFSIENNFPCLVENATDAENTVRFALLENSDPSELTGFVKEIFPSAIVSESLKSIPNPVLSKLKVNDTDRYVLAGTNTAVIARKYLNLSNESNLDEIEKMFTDKTVYLSENTGEFRGAKEIMKMMRSFHSEFESLYWHVDDIRQLSDETNEYLLTLTGKKQNGEEVEQTVLEKITVDADTITRIEITNHK